MECWLNEEKYKQVNKFIMDINICGGVFEKIHHLLLLITLYSIQTGK
jgi:hypothetical protein